MRATLLLRDAQTGHKALLSLWPDMKAWLLAGHRLQIDVRPTQRTLPQNDHIHPLVRRIAKHAGRTDEDTLRALLVEAWRHETRRPKRYMPSLDGLRMVDVSNSTKDLDKQEGSEFIEWLYAWMATNGIETEAASVT